MSGGNATTDPVEQFLNALFGGKEPGEYILIWLLTGRRSAWFADIQEAVEYVHQHRAQDVYVGVALSPQDHGPHLRLKVEGNERPPSSISGLWADIDVTDGVHKKPNLPPDADAAMTILFPELPPSVLVHTGGGLQAWWIFRESWQFQSAEEVQTAGALAARWNRALGARATAKGWALDPVGDLPRILRVPASSNCKIPGHPRRVRLLEISERRYNPSELDEYLDLIGAAMQDTPAAASGIVIAKLTYDPNAEPPADKFQLLCDVEPRFLQSWNRKRSRREFHDQSASAYDMALANVAVQAAWPDQEIADLLIAHRRKHGEKDLKLRDTYLAATIRKARGFFERQMAAEIPRPDEWGFGGSQCR